MEKRNIVLVLICIGLCNIASGQNDDVAKWCAKTGKPQECSMIVHHNPDHTTLKSYPADMGIVLLTAAVEKANGIKQFLDVSLSNGPATANPALMSAFLKCTSPFGLEGANFDANIHNLAMNPGAAVQIADWLAGVQTGVVGSCKAYHPNPVPPVFATLVSKVDDYVTLLKITEQLLRAK